MDANSELDRVIAAQEARLGGVTTRSSTLTAAVAVGAGVVAAQIQVGRPISPLVVGGLALATLAGVLVLIGTRLGHGPTASKISEWSIAHPSDFVDLMVAGKTIAACGNDSRVSFIERVFIAQALLVASSLILVFGQVK